jgi:hypothetical protein
MLVLQVYEKNFVLKRWNTDNERVIIEANHGVNIKLNPIRTGRRSLTIAYVIERLTKTNDDSSNGSKP